MGPVLGPDYSHSIHLIKNLLTGKMPGCPKINSGFVDVRDVADLHLRAISLLPYFELADALPADIAVFKVEEAIRVLRAIDNQVDGLLGNFDKPGKLDLVDFMERNYMFNLPLEKFWYLTGRSLTTFKKDFSKAFNTTPGRWLTQKRLESAHYQIVKKNRKPSEVYLEVGFEDLSHFSFAFKKYFGYNPTHLAPAR